LQRDRSASAAPKVAGAQLLRQTGLEHIPAAINDFAEDVRRYFGVVSGGMRQVFVKGKTGGFRGASQYGLAKC
jgi:hypothetical protein